MNESNGPIKLRIGARARLRRHRCRMCGTGGHARGAPSGARVLPSGKTIRFHASVKV